MEGSGRGLILGTIQRFEPGISRIPIMGSTYFSDTFGCSRMVSTSGYSWTSERNRLHHTSCRQPCGLKALGLQRGIPYEISRDRRS
jgi:hypothetical protein